MGEKPTAVPAESRADVKDNQRTRNEQGEEKLEPERHAIRGNTTGEPRHKKGEAGEEQREEQEIFVHGLKEIGVSGETNGEKNHHETTSDGLTFRCVVEEILQRGIDDNFSGGEDGFSLNRNWWEGENRTLGLSSSGTLPPDPTQESDRVFIKVKKQDAAR